MAVSSPRPLPGLGIPVAVIALTMAAFCIGTSEFVIMGLLVDIASELHVSIARAGILVTAYALGVVFGGPVIAVLTFKFPRKATLIGLVSFFTFGNILCALSPGYLSLLGARIVTSACHGTYFGIATVTAVRLVNPSHKAQAVAWVFMGTTLANMLGVPLGTAEGFHFGWRSTFWTIAALGVLSVIALIIWLPRRLQADKANPLEEFKSLTKPLVQIPLLLSALLNGALFIVYTYITPLLQTQMGLSDHGITMVLLILGIGLPIGTYIGGKLGDYAILPALYWIFPLIMLSLLAVHYFIRLEIPGITALFFWNTLTFTAAPILQLMVVNNADNAPNLASTFNQSAFNLGNAGGAWLGSSMLAAHINLTDLPWASIVVLAGAWALVFIYAQIIKKLPVSV